MSGGSTRGTSCATPGCRWSPSSACRSAACSPGAVITETVFALGRRRPLRRRWHQQPRLLRDPEHDPDLRPRLPRREPPGGHPVRRPQPADQVRLMAAPATRSRRPSSAAPAAGCGATPFRRLLRNRPALLGLVFIAVFVGRGGLRPVPRARTGRWRAGSPIGSRPPSAEHIMGTDLAGSRRVQPRPVRRPGQPRGRRRVGRHGRLHRRGHRRRWPAASAARWTRS